MNYDFWHRQQPGTPLYPDIEWQKPEQKALAGKLLIIGGNAHGFAAVAQAYQDAQKAGIGECRVALPDALKKNIPLSITDTVFVPTNQSGGISKEGLPALKAAVAWADGILFIGDAGRNSETAIVYDELLRQFPDKPTLITRDAADLVKASWPQLIHNQHTVLLITLAQVQKLFQNMYYPRTILFSMQLSNLVDALHKFTTTYPTTLVTFHQNHVLVSQDGQVTTTPWDNPLVIWRGTTAAWASVYLLQHPKQPLQAITTALLLGE